MDLLDRIQKSEYSGTHRNVFIAAPPPPPPKPPGEQSASLFVGPRVPPPPPPLQVPGEFFGYASASGSGRRIAFFKNGDDLQLLAEGDTFRNNLRVVHIGDDSVEVEEVPGGRHVTVKMVQPAPGSDAPQQ
jgi:hypothetical protein